MSNPFATFRKNKNYWMAALVLLSLFAFVIAPAIMQIQESMGGGGGSNAVAVRWNGGKMTVSDLQNAMQKHGALVRFLNDLANEVVKAGGEPKVPGFFYDPQSQQVLGLGIQTSSDEESITRTRILADKAKRLGVEFSDDAIDEFILAFCDGKVATGRIAEILYDSSGGRLSNYDVRQLLKQELAAMVVRRTATTGLYSTVPGETYQDFLKLNRSAKVEAFPVFVADYVSKVQGQPSESELQAIFDLGSMQIANPNSPNPGFVEPYQANLEYVQSNLQEWIEREKAKLTEEQLRAEYDRLVKLEQLKVPVEANPSAAAESDSEAPAGTPDEAPAADNGDAPAESAQPPARETTDKPDTDKPAADEPATEEPTEEPAGQEPATEEPAAEKPAAEKPAAEKPATEEPATEEPAAETPATEEPAAESSEQSSRSLRSPAMKVRLVSALQDDASSPPPVEQPAPLNAEAPVPAPTENAPAAQEDAATAKSDAAPAKEDAAAAKDDAPPVPEPAPADAAAETPAAETPAAETPAAETPAAETPAAEGEASATAAADNAASAPQPAASAAPEMRTQTFEEAREQIAESLARSAAIPALDEALTNLLEKVMKPYYGAYRQYVAFRDADASTGIKKIEEPARPNLKKLAEEAGLTYGVTGMTDSFKLIQTQFGKSSVRQDESGLSGVVANSAMNQQLPLFQPLQSSYFDQEVFQQGRIPEFFQYIFWKTEEQPMQAPQLADVRPQVVEYWKQLQARKLAETAAENLAKKVSGTGDQPWKDALSTSEQSLVVETDPFTWITRMGDYNMPSQVNKLEQVGGQFMRAVFNAKPGSVVVAPSENLAIYYVVRVVDFSPSESELQERFNADPDKRGPLSIAQEESNQLVQDWYENLYQELGVEFKIPLNQL